MNETSSFFTGIQFFDSAKFLELFLKLALDLIVCYIICAKIYYKTYRNRVYLFTFVAFNLIIFLVCYLLNSITLGLGFSFGIFAIFSILRYRTQSLPIQEMTYLFISISIAIINALSNNSIPLSILFLTNIILVLAVYILEKKLSTNEKMKLIVYERIDLIKPQKREELIADLKERTGLDIKRVQVGKIDYLKDIAELKILFVDKGNTTYVSQSDTSKL